MTACVGSLGWASWADLFPLLIALPTHAVKFADAVGTASPSGMTTIENSTRANGTATDNLGNTYVFNYSNSFRVSNTTAHPGTFSGMMTDAFSLAGNGPAQLHNGFDAGITSSDGFVSASWAVKSSRGDPISFSIGPIEAAHHCDPI